uniref:Uncharacterized protein n=1 Tax=Aegilops tauschii subsp. strangulata TaxID=200361 RepID=A0A453I1Z5_AEGTS
MSPPWSSLEEEHRSSIPMSPPPSSPPSHPMSPLLSSPEEEHPPSERATPELILLRLERQACPYSVLPAASNTGLLCTLSILHG